MKGQLTLEYLISFLVFIGIIAYVYLSYSANIPSFVDEVKKEDSRSKAFQLSELLINDPGEPTNWNSSSKNEDIKRIGLLDHNSNKQNLISMDKVDKLIAMTGFPCPSDGYNNLTSKLALEKNFSVIISEIELSTGNRNPLYTCMPSIPPREAINVTLIRVVVVNNSGSLTPGEVIIQM